MRRANTRARFFRNGKLDPRSSRSFTEPHFERGLLPGTLVDDSKILPGEFKNIAHNWSPANSDNEYMGLQPAALGLLKSRNTMSVRVGEFAGLATIRHLAQYLGIAESMPDLPAVFLGAFETTLKDLTAAYTIFPNLGVKRAPHLVARIEAADGQILYSADQSDRRILSQESAWMVSWILQHVMKTGTAAKAVSLGWKKPAAGKTGTTNDFFDAWFVGYTSSLTCGVWVGMDEPQPIMEKGYGSALALPIWVDFMQQVPDKIYPATPFQAPVPLVSVRLCSASGGRATSQCEQLRLGYETHLPVNRVPAYWCPHHPQPQMPTLYLTSAGLSPSTPPASRNDPVQCELSMPPPAVSSSVRPINESAEAPREPQHNSLAENSGPPVVMRSLRTGEVARIQPPVEQPPQPVRVLRAIPVDRTQQLVRPYDPGRVWRGEAAREQGRRVIRAFPAMEPE
jgi:penicillin-binding protein 1A